MEHLFVSLTFWGSERSPRQEETGVSKGLARRLGQGPGSQAPELWLTVENDRSVRRLGNWGDFIWLNKPHPFGYRQFLLPRTGGDVLETPPSLSREGEPRTLWSQRQFEVCPALSSRSPAAPEVFCSSCSLRPRPGNTFLGRWRQCRCFKHQLEGFRLIIAAGVSMPRAAIEAWVGARCPGSELNRGLGRGREATWGRCPRPCDSGNRRSSADCFRGPRGALHVPVLRTWSFPVALGGSQPRSVTLCG